MKSYMFYLLNRKSKSIKLSCAKGENITEAFNNAIFTIYSINDIYLSIMGLYDIITALNNWISNSSGAITHSKKEIEHYTAELSTITRLKKNIIVDFVVDKLYNNFITYRNDVNSSAKLLIRVWDSWIYFPEKKELQHLQKNITSCVSENFLIKEDEEAVIFNNKNLIINDICQYIDNNGTAYNVITDSLLPFISDIIQFIVENDLKMKKCTNCHKYFVVDKSDKKITCSAKCRNEHLDINKKTRLEHDLIKSESEEIYEKFSKRCYQRCVRLAAANAHSDIVNELVSLTKLHRIELRKLKKKTNAREISLDDFKSILDEYDSASKITYEKHMEDLKNGEHKKTQ